MNKTFTSALYIGVCVVPLVGLATGAKADFVDYGTLEETFGEAVTTSATGKPQRISEVPMAMTIVNAEQIKRSAAVDIPGILREYTDLDVWQWGRGSSDVSSRGFNGPWSSRMLVLVNGRQVYLDYRGFTNWQALPIQLSEIRQIEVVKGPNSALFGFNAAGGVINIVTFSPLYDKVNEATLRIGSDAYREASGVVSAQLGDIGGIRASAGGTNAHAFSTTSEDAPGGATVDPQKRSLNIDGAFRLGPDVQAGLEASYNADELYQFSDLTIGSFTRTRTGSIKGNVAADTKIGSVEATAYHNLTLVDADNRLTNKMNSTRNPLTVLKLQDLFKIGSSHTMRIGGEYRHETVDSVPDNGLKINSQTFSGSAMWDWAVTPKVNWTNAVRFDHFELDRSGTPEAGQPTSNAEFDRSIDKFSVNSGAVYKVTDDDSIRLSFGRGLQLPSLLQYAAQSSGALAATGNPYLTPTVVTNYELGYNHDLRDLGIHLNSAVFYQTNESLMSMKRGANQPYPNFIAYTNIGDADAYGVELGADGKTSSGFRWGGTWRYEYIHEDMSVDNSALSYPVDFSGSAPHHLLSARAGYTWGKADIDLFARYSTAYSLVQGNATTQALKNFEVPATATLDMRVGYALTDDITVALHGLSIQSKSTTYTSGPDVERQVYGTFSIKF